MTPKQFVLAFAVGLGLALTVTACNKLLFDPPARQSVRCMGPDGPIQIVEPDDKRGSLSIDEYGVVAPGLMRYWPNYGTVCVVEEFKTEEQLLEEHLKEIKRRLKEGQNGNVQPKAHPIPNTVEPGPNDLDASTGSEHERSSNDA